MPNRLRLMMCGRPKSGKTGSLVALLNAGFEVGVLDFDGNSDPLKVFTDAKMLKNLSVVTLQDRRRLGSGNAGGKEFVQLATDPTALKRAFQALEDWSKFDPEHQWGPVKNWGLNRVLVLDSLTSMGDASYERIKFINGRGSMNVRDSDWGLAMKDQEFTLSKLMSTEYQCHVIAMAHLKMIGPRLERIGNEDTPDLMEAKIAISRANSEMVPTRLYPSALGRALPQDILRHVPACVVAEVDAAGNRVLITKPSPGIAFDVGVPGKVKGVLPLESGLLDIMSAVAGIDKPSKGA